MWLGMIDWKKLYLLINTIIILVVVLDTAGLSLGPTVLRWPEEYSDPVLLLLQATVCLHVNIISFMCPVSTTPQWPKSASVDAGLRV